MKFECGDLERALAQADLMPEAREHLKTCSDCRREYRLWNEISSHARTLHEDWDTPALWPDIRKAIQAEPKPITPFWKRRTVWALVATLVVAASLGFMFRLRTMPTGKPAAEPAVTAENRDFLTEQALSEVEKNEAAYRRSIERLARLAEPKLEAKNSPAAANAREKLSLLDSAIQDTRANVKVNRFNARLQLTLANLYREKQETLQELTTRERKN